MSPFTLFDLNLRMTALMLDTQAVIALRLLAIGGILPARRGENQRMLAEKAPAWNEAWSAATSAMLAGQRPDQVLAASMAPLGRKVRANRKRLSK
ncbi:antifreeze protein [Sulfitobacter aestuarii]|uniref:Antifreeze protein n=1 Tax=Sulfitobacter aestuarii TaxID=2161676 RepID=A0ABW5U4L5_9RHOB